LFYNELINMNNFQEGFKKKIFLGMGLLLIFIFLIFVLFVLPKKKMAEKEKKAEILKEAERIEKEITELEKEKERVEEKIAEILTQTEAKEDILVKGVEIIKKDDKKLIRNKKQGYEIEIPSQMLLARSIEGSELNFFIPDQEGYLSCPGLPAFPSDLTISVEKKTEKISLEEWVKRNKKEIYLNTEGEVYFQEFGWQKIGENNWYKIEVWIERVIPVLTSEYFLERDDKIYNLFISQWLTPLIEDCSQKLPPEEAEKLLQNFKLI